MIYILRYSIISFAAIMLTTNVAASVYQSKASFAYSSTSYDSGYDMTLMGFSGVYYFSPISSTSGPLNEAAFLAKASSIGFLINTVTYDIGVTTLNGNGYAFNAMYIAHESDIFLNITYGDEDLSDLGVSLETTLTLMKLGKYLEDKTLLYFLYNIATRSATGLSDADFDKIGIAIKHLFDAGGTMVNLEGSFTQLKKDDSITEETNTEFFVGGDFYIDNYFSIGYEIGLNTGDDVSLEGNTISFNIVSFLNDTTSIDIEYSRFSANDSTADDNSTIFFHFTGHF